jgi:predicted RNA methylase
MLRRGLNALRVSLRRDGLIGTLAKAPKLARFVQSRIASRRYYLDFHRTEDAEGFDRIHGTDTSSIVETFELNLSGPGAREAVRYEPAHVSDVERALKSLKIDHRDFTLIDLGSGKGRTLLVASRYPFKKLIGVELSAELHAVSQRNAETFRAKEKGIPPIELVCSDVQLYPLPEENTVFYLFNPFGAAILQKVIDNVCASLDKKPRKLGFVYVFPAHQEVIDKTGRFKRIHTDPRFIISANW